MNSLIDPKKKEDARRDILGQSFSRNKPAPEPPQVAEKQEPSSSAPLVAGPATQMGSGSGPILAGGSGSIIVSKAVERRRKEELDRGLLEALKGQNHLYNNEEEAERLVNEGADVNARDGGKWTPLMYAISNPHLYALELVEFLLDKGADVNAESGVGHGPCQGSGLHLEGRSWDPLRIAAFSASWHSRNQEELLNLLIRRGANVNSRNNLGETPLIISCYQRQKAVVELLLRSGADLYARAYSRDITAYGLASKNGFSEIVALLRTDWSKR